MLKNRRQTLLDPQKPGYIVIVRPSDKSDANILAEGPQVVQGRKYNRHSTTAKEGFKNHTGAFEEKQLRHFVLVTTFTAKK